MMQIGAQAKVLSVQIERVDTDAFRWALVLQTGADAHRVEGSGPRWALLEVLRAATERVERYLKDDPSL